MASMTGLAPSPTEASSVQTWHSAPREALLLVFRLLSVKERALVIPAVCSWWRRVALEEELLPDLNLCTVPIFAVRAQHLPGFLQQRKSFACWLESRAPHIRSCILQAERWEDDGLSVHLRVATAQILGPHLHSLKLVSTGSGQVTSAFLQHGSALQLLQIDFWGAGNGLPKQLTCCTALTALRIQCSSRLARYADIGSLKSLRELAVVDSDWTRIPQEVAGLPCLTRLFLRFADFESSQWLPEEAVIGARSPAGTARGPPIEAACVAPCAPGGAAVTAAGTASLSSRALASAGTAGGPGPTAAAGIPSAAGVGPHALGMARTLQALTLHACHLAALPPRLGLLTALTALVLDRNGALQELPPFMSSLTRLRLLSLEGCRSLTRLGEAVPELPLESLNLQESGVGELPQGYFNGTLTSLFWHLPPVPEVPSPATPLAQPLHQFVDQGEEEQQPPVHGGNSSAVGSLSGVSMLPGAQRAYRLHEIYLAGKPENARAEPTANWLFGVLSELDRVCVPLLGRTYRRYIGKG
ncbi:hypothetical protein N2152v2_001444 [Parachlorella kessleri]